MSEFELLQNQRVELRLLDRTYQARVLDTFPDVLVLRVPPEIADLDAPPAVEIGFGYQSWFFYADVSVEAYFSQAWFVARPDPAQARKVQQRRFVRIRLESIVTAMESNVYGEPSGAPFALKLENVSAGGCLATVDREFASEYLMIFLNLLETDAEVVIGRVVQRHPRPDGCMALGIAFDNFDPGRQEELAQQIQREIRRNLRDGRDITV